MNDARLKEIEARWISGLDYSNNRREGDLEWLFRVDVPSLLFEIRRLQNKEATLENQIRLMREGKDWDGIQSLSPPTVQGVSKESERMDAIENRLNALEVAEQERKKIAFQTKIGWIPPSGPS